MKISEFFPTKSVMQIIKRWTKVLDPSLLKGSWTPQEDETIIDFVRDNGTKSWARLSELLPGRIGKQCRERWFNALDPAMNREPWTPEEDKRLVQLHAQYGNRWAQISGLMPMRSDNAIKNRWNSVLSKRVDSATPAPTPAPTPVASRSKTPLPSIALLVGGDWHLECLTLGGYTDLPVPEDGGRRADGVALEQATSGVDC
jgi:hypothetical protein